MSTTMPLFGSDGPLQTFGEAPTAAVQRPQSRHKPSALHKKASTL